MSYAQRDIVLQPVQSQAPPVVAEGDEQNPATWLFDSDTFAPMGKMVDGRYYPIVTDYLGTPTAMFDDKGQKVWSADISVWGDLRNLEGERQTCPFRWPGQYEDEETGLYYNRFRYYDADAGQYVSQDPCGLAGNNPGLYGYVFDVTNEVDPLGLSCTPRFNPAKQFPYSKGGRMSVLKHILQRHRASTKYSDVSKFLTDSPKKIQSLIREGLQTGVVDHGARSVTATFSRNIGRDQNGKLTNKMIMYFDDKGWIRTAFPL